MTSAQKMTLAQKMTYVLCSGWECEAVVEFVVDVVVVVVVGAPAGRGDAGAAPRPAVADPRESGDHLGGSLAPGDGAYE